VDRTDEFRAFVQRHVDDLRRAAWLLTGDAEDASDLVQETLTRLYPQWDRVANADSAFAYVRKCLLRQYLTESRRHRLLTVSDTYLEGHVDPHDHLDTVPDQLLLARHLKSLTPIQRTAIVLKFYYDLTDSDAGRVLKCPVTTYRSHLRRGLAALRKHMASAPSEPCTESPKGAVT
jgi:RNA polymerase sigma-70 factor (sigma-E family)